MFCLELAICKRDSLSSIFCPNISQISCIHSEYAMWKELHIFNLMKNAIFVKVVFSFEYRVINIPTLYVGIFITEIRKVEEGLTWSQKPLNIKDLKNYWRKLIENLWKIASNTRDRDTIKLLFDFTFMRNPTYPEILNRNTPLRPMLALQNQQKILQEGEFSKNLWWQLCSESNWGQRLWRPLH